MKSGILFFILLTSFSARAQDSLFRKQTVNAALNILNNTRKTAGLDTVALSADLSKGCYAHAKYLVINRSDPKTVGLNAHKEFSDLKGYTKAGETAGKNAVIHYVMPGEAIAGWINTFYHRIPLLQPDLKEIGIGFYKSKDYVVSLVECISGKQGTPEMDIVFYPAENQKDVPLMMGPEIPHPMGIEGEYGYPITAYFTKWQKITGVIFKLTDLKGNLVHCSVSTPQMPATDFSQWNTICAIPKKPLTPETMYTVSISCNVDGKAFKKNYSFQTGKAP